MADNAKGVLFKNDRKVPDSKQPDYTGNIEVTPAFLQALLKEAQGTGAYKARLAAWIRQGPNGRFISVSLEAPYTGGGARNDPSVVPTRKPSGPFGDDEF